MKKLANIGLGMAIALLICLLPMPYGYYILVRFAAMIFFICLAVSFNNREETTYAVIAGAVALLFQPFFKVALGREMWNVVDFIVAIALFAFWLKQKKNN